MKKLYEIEIIGKTVIIRALSEKTTLIYDNISESPTVGAGSTRTATNGLKDHLDGLLSAGETMLFRKAEPPASAPPLPVFDEKGPVKN